MLYTSFLCIFLLTITVITAAAVDTHKLAENGNLIGYLVGLIGTLIGLVSYLVRNTSRANEDKWYSMLVKQTETSTAMALNLERQTETLAKVNEQLSILSERMRLREGRK